MVDIAASATRNFGNEFVFHLAPARQHGLVATLSDHSLKVLPFEPSSFNKSIVDYQKAHSNTISGLQAIDPHTVGTSSMDGSIKVWDLRIGSRAASQEFRAEGGVPLTCLDVYQGKLAAGTELVGQDAGVVLWDMRTPQKAFVSYMDAHSEDVTQVQFHRDEANGLLSAAQDGYIHIYDTSILDMDEAVYQTINHNSAVDKCGFLPNRTVYAKSNMETMALYTIPNPDSEDKDAKPLEFGDLRSKFNCEYVADVLNGFVAVGTNTSSSFRVIPWDYSSDKSGQEINLVGAHNEEVVRAVHLDALTQCIYTGGEDGCVKVWKPSEPLNIESGEWQQVKKKKKSKKDKKDKKDKKKSDKKFKPY